MTRKCRTVISVIAYGSAFAFFMSNHPTPNEQEVQRAAEELARLFVAMIDMKYARKKKLTNNKQNNNGG